VKDTITNDPGAYTPPLLKDSHEEINKSKFFSCLLIPQRYRGHRRKARPSLLA